MGTFPYQISSSVQVPVWVNPRMDLALNGNWTRAGVLAGIPSIPGMRYIFR